MRVVVQRVRRAVVRIGETDERRIDVGLVVLAAAAKTDEFADADYLADKLANLRIMDLGWPHGAVGIGRRRLGDACSSIHPLCRYAQGEATQLFRIRES